MSAPFDFRVCARWLAMAWIPAAGVVYVAACTGDDPDPLSATPDGGEEASTDAGGDEDDDGSLTECDGGAVDTSTSSEHCGACGHDCAGGACSGGRCQPLTIAENLSRPYGVTVGGTGVLWVRGDADGGAVESCPISGCKGAPPTLITDAVSPLNHDPPTGVTMVSNGLYVYWVGGGRTIQPGLADNVFGCNITFCSLAELSGNGSSAIQLARSGDDLYFRLTSGAIRGCKFGACPETPESLVGGLDGSLGFAVADGRMFYVSRYDPGPDNIFTCTPSTSPAGCSGVTPMFSAPNVSFLGVANGILYAVSGTSLLACGVGGCSNAPDTLTTALPPVTAFAVDDNAVYVADRGTPGTKTGSIQSCALPTCAGGVRTIASGLASPTSLWVDQGLVYWSEAGDAPGTGAIRRIRP